MAEWAEGIGVIFCGWNDLFREARLSFSGVSSSTAVSDALGVHIKSGGTVNGKDPLPRKNGRFEKKSKIKLVARSRSTRNYSEIG